MELPSVTLLFRTIQPCIGAVFYGTRERTAARKNTTHISLGDYPLECLRMVSTSLVSPIRSFNLASSSFTGFTSLRDCALVDPDVPSWAIATSAKDRLPEAVMYLTDASLVQTTRPWTLCSSPLSANSYRFNLHSAPSLRFKVRGPPRARIPTLCGHLEGKKTLELIPIKVGGSGDIRAAH